MNFFVRLFSKAVCELPCGNGGHCVAPNICQCPSDYTGLQCLTREYMSLFYGPTHSQCAVLKTAPQCGIYVSLIPAFPGYGQALSQCLERIVEIPL